MSEMEVSVKKVVNAEGEEMSYLVIPLYPEEAEGKMMKGVLRFGDPQSTHPWTARTVNVRFKD